MLRMQASARRRLRCVDCVSMQLQLLTRDQNRIDVSARMTHEPQTARNRASDAAASASLTLRSRLFLPLFCAQARLTGRSLR